MSRIDAYEDRARSPIWRGLRRMSALAEVARSALMMATASLARGTSGGMVL